MADADAAARIAEIERLCADPHTAFYQFYYVYNHTRWLLTQLAAKDRELAGLKEILGGLCEDSHAAAVALHYRKALEQMSATKFSNESGVWWDAGAMYRIAKTALETAP